MTTVLIDGEAHHIHTSDERTTIVHAETKETIFEHEDREHAMHVIEGMFAYR